MEPAQLARGPACARELREGCDLTLPNGSKSLVLYQAPLDLTRAGPGSGVALRATFGAGPRSTRAVTLGWAGAGRRSELAAELPGTAAWSQAEQPSQRRAFGRRRLFELEGCQARRCKLPGPGLTTGPSYAAAASAVAAARSRRRGGAPTEPLVAVPGRVRVAAGV